MAAILQPKIVFTPPGGSATTLQFINGPQAFMPHWQPRQHKNLSTSGAVQEVVTEAMDILISFEMRHQIVDGDMPGWGAFMAYALTGGTFVFYPNASLPDAYNCVLELGEWKPNRNAPRKYSTQYVFRCLNDGTAPSDPGAVLRRFYGVTT